VEGSKGARVGAPIGAGERSQDGISTKQKTISQKRTPQLGRCITISGKKGIKVLKIYLEKKQKRTVGNAEELFD